MQPIKLFLVKTHPAEHNVGIPAEIIGVAMALCKVPVWVSENVIMLPGEEKMLHCFRLRYPDGSEEYVPIFCPLHLEHKDPFHEFITEQDLIEGRIPKANH